MILAAIGAVGAIGFMTLRNSSNSPEKAQEIQAVSASAVVPSSASVAASPLPAVGVASAAASSPAAAQAGFSSSVSAQAKEDDLAQLPPTPKAPEKGYLMFGVVYDLATKKPIAGARVDITMVFAGAKTDAHGWYSVRMGEQEASFMKANVSVSSAGYVSFFPEHAPPLASLSPVRRRTFAAEEDSGVVMVDLSKVDSLFELDFAMAPRKWPTGFPEPEFSDVEDPPQPGPGQGSQTCRLYGIVYDVATKRPIRRAKLALALNSGGRYVTRVQSRRRTVDWSQPHRDEGRPLFTNGRGRYQVDIHSNQLNESSSIGLSLEGYRPGLAADRSPSLRTLADKERRELAEAIDYDTVPLPYDDCRDGVFRFDMFVMPEHWPTRGP